MAGVDAARAGEMRNLWLILRENLFLQGTLAIVLLAIFIDGQMAGKLWVLWIGLWAIFAIVMVLAKQGWGWGDGESGSGEDGE